MVLFWTKFVTWHRMQKNTSKEWSIKMKQRQLRQKLVTCTDPYYFDVLTDNLQRLECTFCKQNQNQIADCKLW